MPKTLPVLAFLLALFFSSGAAGQNSVIVLSFDALDSALSAAHEQSIKESILPLLTENKDGFIEVRAYASGDSGQASAARRISLERALAVEAFLLAQGVDERRLYLRPLGPAPEDSDYVEIAVLKP
ncbi:MAG: OmpA family protein [Alphaproteobacteria bacterium]